MSHALDSSKYTVFVGSDASVSPVLNYETKVQELDKESGLPIWRSAPLEIINKVDNSVEAGVRLKLVAKEAPVLTPRTEHGVTNLTLTVWNNEGRPGLSYKHIGPLTGGSGAPAAPAAPKVFPPKD